MHKLSTLQDLLVRSDARQDAVEFGEEGVSRLEGRELAELLSAARADRVLYRLHRARYGRSMRRLAAGLGIPEKRHAERLSDTA